MLSISKQLIFIRPIPLPEHAPVEIILILNFSSELPIVAVFSTGNFVASALAKYSSVQFFNPLSAAWKAAFCCWLLVDMRSCKFDCEAAVMAIIVSISSSTRLTSNTMPF